jgi:hypothetical protein
MWHKHDWKEVKRFSTPPRSTFEWEGEMVAAEIVKDALFGFTQVELECLSCREIKFIKVQGHTEK